MSTPYTLPDLPYDYDALSPWCDEETLHLHHDKHHKAYVDGANAALEALASVDPADKTTVAGLDQLLEFNLSGHILHTLFWENLTPDVSRPSGDLESRLAADFGSVERAESLFTAACMGVRGSGWGVLAYEPLGDKLHITSCKDHQNNYAPGLVNLAVVDVWEHAYYVVHRNDRAAWVKQAVQHINWPEVSARLAGATG